MTTHPCPLPALPSLALLRRCAPAGVVALALILGLPCTKAAAGAAETFVVVAQQRTIQNADVICFRLVTDQDQDARVSVQVRFSGTPPRGALVLDGNETSAITANSQTFEFQASARGIHRLAFELTEPVTMDLLSVSAATSPIETASCGANDVEPPRPLPAVVPAPEAAAPAAVAVEPAAPAEPGPAHLELRVGGMPVEAAPETPLTMIPAGTPIELRLDRAVSPRTHRTGQLVTARLASPLVVAGRTALPTGTRVTGTVTESQRAGTSRPARLRIDFHRAILADGTAVKFSSSVQCLGPGAALAPGAAAPGKPTVLRAGTILAAQLDRSTAVPRAGNR